MEKKELKEFTHFLIHKKDLSSEQRRRIEALLVRDFLFFQNHTHKVDYMPDNVDESSPCVHNPMPIVDFLHQFTESQSLALKYTVHYWDKDVNGEYPYKNFDDFKSSYLILLNDKDGRPLEQIRQLCEHLWKTVKNFLVNDDAWFTWSEHKLKIGFNKYLKEWMDLNPNKQPFSMPIKAFPDEIRPGLINGKELIYFGDVVDIFKHCIEFRDNDLYFAVKRIFGENPDFNIDISELKSLKGRSFYTDTELVKEALSLIAHNIFPRSGFPKLSISCKMINDLGNNKLRLTILQQDSFSDRDINDSKILGNMEEGDLSRIIKKLTNICDFSIESRFRSDNKEKHCRINYLISQNANTPKVEEIDEYPCLGFSYILTFYLYKHE